VAAKDDKKYPISAHLDEPYPPSHHPRRRLRSPLDALRPLREWPCRPQPCFWSNGVPAAQSPTSTASAPGPEFHIGRVRRLPGEIGSSEDYQRNPAQVAMCSGRSDDFSSCCAPNGKGADARFRAAASRTSVGHSTLTADQKMTLADARVARRLALAADQRWRPSCSRSAGNWWAGWVHRRRHHRLPRRISCNGG